jgi:hypothetical protein
VTIADPFRAVPEIRKSKIETSKKTTRRPLSLVAGVIDHFPVHVPDGPSQTYRVEPAPPSVLEYSDPTTQAPAGTPVPRVQLGPEFPNWTVGVPEPVVVKESATKGSEDVKVPPASVIDEFPNVDVPVHFGKDPTVAAAAVAYDPAR